MDAPAPPIEIVVVAPRLEEAPGERAFSSVEIAPALIEGAARLDQVLSTSPGVSLFRRNNSAAANPTIQGLNIRAGGATGAGRVLVTLGGAPLNDPFGGWVIWGALPPDTIAHARIVRGAGAGPYGAGALQGAVELEERRGQGARLTLESGERGYARATGFGEAGDSAFSLMLAASAERSDGWTPVREGHGAADIPLTYESASAVARVQAQRGERVFSLRLAGYGESKSAGLVGAESVVSGSSLALSLADPGGTFGWRVQAWANASDLANTSVATAPDRNSTTPANDQYETPALGWGANAALRWSGAASGIELGADVRAADGETNELFRFMSGAFTRSRTAGGQTFIAGGYVEAWRARGPWLFAGGARLDQWRSFDARRIERDLATDAATLNVAPDDNDTLTPTARLAARRQLSDGLAVRGALYAGFRPPTLNELHRPFRVGNDVTEANAALEPERLAGGDLALEYETGAAAWRIGLFATQLDDAIANVTLGAGPGTFPPGVFVPAGGAYRQRQNIGRIDAWGVEADARGRLAETLTWRTALNYTDAVVRGGTLEGLAPAQSPEWSAHAGLDWRIADRTTLSANLSYESARFEDDLNSRELSPALMTGFAAEQRLSASAALFAVLDNAFDTAVETAETADGVESFAAPRAFRVGLRLRTL